MALIKCSECGREISDKATACPLCGIPMNGGSGFFNKTQAPAKKESNGCLQLVGVGFLLFIVISVINGFNSGYETESNKIATEAIPDISPTPDEKSWKNVPEKPLGYIPPIGDKIPSRDSATYTLMDIKFKGKNVFITTQRDGKSGRSYSTREIKCPGKQARYLATGDTMEEFKASNMKQSFSESYSDSIQGEIASYACTQLLLKNLSK